MSTQQQQPDGKPAQKPIPFIPSKKPNSDFPLIDNDPHFRRVWRYTRPTDYLYGAGMFSIPPGLLLIWERVAPSFVGKGGFAAPFRLSVALGGLAGFIFTYQRSCLRFYGCTENKREIDMDMREMVDKVKKGESLYGKSELTEHMQGVAHRNSRYAGVFLHVVPMFNFVNHPYHGVDTAKYYQQAERELEAERLAKGVKWTDG